MIITKLQKKSYWIISIALIISLIIAVVTRNSYFHISANNINKATISVAIHEKEEEYSYTKENFFEYFDYTKNNCDTVLVVSIKKNIYQYSCTKSVASVKKVLNNNEINIGDTIIIYEPNYFYYDKLSNEVKYCENVVGNNILKEECEYLVFLKSRIYSEKYQNTLNCNEFTAGDFRYSFKLDYNQTSVLKLNESNFYDAYKNLEFFCTKKSSLNEYNEFKNSILEEYLI